MKVCSCCKKELSLDNFCKAKRSKDGHGYWCKTCKRNWHLVHYDKDQTLKNSKLWRKNNPWYSSYGHAKQRCTNSNNEEFHNYGGRGIKFLMTMIEFKKLWYRDKAYLMNRPSIDRIDTDGNYKYNNCRYLELGANAGRANTKNANLYFNLI